MASPATEAADRVVRDRVGVAVGRVTEAPDGSLTIRDRVGVAVGRVDAPRPAAASPQTRDPVRSALDRALPRGR